MKIYRFFICVQDFRNFLLLSPSLTSLATCISKGAAGYWRWYAKIMEYNSEPVSRVRRKIALTNDQTTYILDLEVSPKELWLLFTF